MIGAKEAISRFFTRYFDFRGRSSRAEFWWPQLAIFLLMVGAGGALSAMGYDSTSDEIRPAEWIILAPLTFLLFAIVIPSIALLVRRFHDINRSGLLVIPIYVVGLIPLVQFLSFIAFIVVGCIPGTKGTNGYGEPPTVGAGTFR